MKIIEPSFEFMHMPDGEFVLRHLEQAARTCYKSEDKAGADSARKLLSRIIRLGHDSVLEHIAVTVRIVCDRGVSHELVRHRMCSFSQESTRYVKYDGEIAFIRPPWVQDSAYVNGTLVTDSALNCWEDAMYDAEQAYKRLLEYGWSPQEARTVLPNSLKTEIVMTANLREWRHIFKLRCDKAAHPQMRQVMTPLLAAFAERIPLLFDDLGSEFLPIAAYKPATAEAGYME